MPYTTNRDKTDKIEEQGGGGGEGRGGVPQHGVFNPRTTLPNYSRTDRDQLLGYVVPHLATVRYSPGFCSSTEPTRVTRARSRGLQGSHPGARATAIDHTDHTDRVDHTISGVDDLMISALKYLL